MEKKRLERLQEQKRMARRKLFRRSCWILSFIMLIVMVILWLPGSPAGFFSHLPQMMAQWNQPAAPSDSEAAPDSPEAEEEAEVEVMPVNPSAPLRILFLGDTMMTGRVAAVMDNQGMHYPLQEFAPLLDEVDLIVANLETAVGTSGEVMDKSYVFQTDPRYLELFAPYWDKLVFTLANNHGMDAPVMETMNALERGGFHYVGIGRNRDAAYEPYVGEINGVSFAIFGASRVIPVASWRAGEDHPGMATVYNPASLLEHVAPWVDRVDYVITYLHWGVELADTPEPYQLSLEEALYEAGVNLIIGSHPHVLQAMEWRGPKAFTAYSMGNFVFTTSNDPKANDTGALELWLSSDEIQEAFLHPAEVRWGLVRCLTDAEERQRVIDRVNGLNETVLIDEEGRFQSVR
jgi:hypothetical protein